MKLDLTPDQKSFHTTTKQFLGRTVPIENVREMAAGEQGFARDWWRRGAELGWTSMLVPEELGGGSVSGMPVTDLSIVAEEMGRVCAPGPLVTASAVLAGLVRAGDRFEEVVQGVIAGEQIPAWAFYEPDYGLRETTSGTTATPEGDGFRLSGVKDRVEAGDQADLFLVGASGPDGPVQVLIPKDAAGLTVERTWSLDMVRRTARITLDGVLVPADAVVSTGADAEASVRRQLHVAATLTAAELCGVIGRTLEFTLQWLTDRYSFGRPLASYQALKHRMADMTTWSHAGLAIADAAARELDDGAGDPALTVFSAKSYIGSKAPGIVQDCIQLHGGIGVTWEHDLHLYLRRATLGRSLYGTPEELRRRITDLLEEGIAA